MAFIINPDQNRLKHKFNIYTVIINLPLYQDKDKERHNAPSLNQVEIIDCYKE